MIAHVYYICKIVLQLSELVTVEGYSDWIRLVAEFTLKSLQSWQVGWCLLLSCTSVRMMSMECNLHYLLCLCTVPVGQQQCILPIRAMVQIGDICTLFER